MIWLDMPFVNTSTLVFQVHLSQVSEAILCMQVACGLSVIFLRPCLELRWIGIVQNRKLQEEVTSAAPCRYSSAWDLDL